MILPTFHGGLAALEAKLEDKGTFYLGWRLIEARDGRFEIPAGLGPARLETGD